MHVPTRTSGLLLHPTSLPEGIGCGDLGAGARAFVDFLARAQQGLWQILPLHPPGPGDSPYQTHSAFAGSPLLIDLEELVEAGLLDRGALEAEALRPRSRADFAEAARRRGRLLRAAFRAFEEHPPAGWEAELDDHRAASDAWLEDYALYAALKRAARGAPWFEWDAGLRDRRADALARARDEHAAGIRFEAFLQLVFARQWRALRAYAAERGVRVLGDLPMYVAHDSADVWARRELFQLDAEGHPRSVAGAPPDAFNAGGQVWGHPPYRWDAVADDGWKWWVERVRHALAGCDLLRLDHFLGYQRAWSVPTGSAGADAGAYEQGPGAALFEVLQAQLGRLPFVAEDLGDATPAAEELRDRFGFAGMRVLQFGFGPDSATSPHVPHNHVPDCVAYTGTHDNDTAAGWFRSLRAGDGAPGPDQQRVLDYAGSDGRAVHWDLVRLTQLSVARTAVVPVQDLLGLGSRSRMNRPGSPGSNWRWRLRRGALDGAVEERLAELTALGGRGRSPVGAGRDAIDDERAGGRSQAR